VKGIEKDFAIYYVALGLRVAQKLGQGVVMM
jgi:hypothetical protein